MPSKRVKCGGGGVRLAQSVLMRILTASLRQISPENTGNEASQQRTRTFRGASDEVSFGIGIPSPRRCAGAELPPGSHVCPGHGKLVRTQ